jgi:hypothetical protein
VPNYSLWFSRQNIGRGFGKDTKTSQKVIDEILKLNKNGESKKITLNSQTVEVCLGLSDDAIKKVKSARKLLPVAGAI